MATGDAQLAAVAHVLRRTTFGPFPDRTEAELSRHGTSAAVLRAQLDAEPIPFDAPAKIDEPLDLLDKRTNDGLADEWFRRMASDAAGLHEKMMWFWHSHFTTGLTKSTGVYCWRQLRLFHRQALGNFGEMTKELCVDGAMLQWLDGGGSQASNPNENFARELMELFTMGRGHYTEADVRASARAMAGWSVLPEVAMPTLSSYAQLHEPVTFMGITAVFDPDLIVERILQHEATAPFIVSKLARYFIGSSVTDQDIAAWAATFRDSGYEIRPVIHKILRSEAFAQSRYGRARHGIEWLCAATRAANLPQPVTWDVKDFAQYPYEPLNVAGWPDRWLSTSSLFARASYLYSADVTLDLPAGVAGADWALRHCGIFEPSDATRSALRTIARGGNSPALLRAALVSPEFALS